MTNQEMEKQAANLGRQLQWTTVLFLWSWFAWALLMLKPVQTLPYLRDIPPDTTFVWGAIVFAAALALMASTLWRIKRNRKLCGMLNDERTRDNWRRALGAGYYALFAALLAAIVAMKLHAADESTLLMALLMIGAGVPTLANVWLERAPA